MRVLHQSALPSEEHTPLDAEALIHQARQRQRRRRARIAVVVGALALTGVAIGITKTSDSAHPGDHPRPAPSARTYPGSGTVALDRPEALALARDGSLLIVDQGSNQILSRQADGKLSVVAGTGRAGYSGDGGLAVRAELDHPGGIAVAPNGAIYVADTFNNRVRAIWPSGLITTVAGTGRPGQGGTGEAATDADVSQPVAVAAGPAGNIYIADDAGIQVISSTARLASVVPAGPARLNVGGTPTAFFPSALAVDAVGNLYAADSSPKLLVEFSPNGRILVTWTAYVTPGGLAAGADGSVLVADYGQFAVDRVNGTRLTPVASFIPGSIPGLTGTFRPSGIAAGPNGEFYVDTDGSTGGPIGPPSPRATARAEYTSWT